MCGLNEEEMKRVERLCRSEKTPEGSVVNWWLWRANVKGGKERERIIMEWRSLREERPVSMEEGREERPLEARSGGRDG